MKNIYFASRFTPNRTILKEECQKYDGRFRNVSRWLDEQDGCTAAEAAQRDIEDIKTADVLIVYTVGCEAVPGGMWFEMGYACALGKPVIIVGPRVNVFCHLPQITTFDTLQEAILYAPCDGTNAGSTPEATET